MNYYDILFSKFLNKGGATGAIQITENGTYDVSNYASAEVNVPSGGSIPMFKGHISAPQGRTQYVRVWNGSAIEEVRVDENGSDLELLYFHDTENNQTILDTGIQQATNLVNCTFDGDIIITDPTKDSSGDLVVIPPLG